MRPLLILLSAVSIVVASNHQTLLLDTSGSMANQNVEVKQVVAKYLQNKSIEVYGFNDLVFPILRAEEVSMNGGTDLAGALRFMNRKGSRPKSLIVVTDGSPDNSDDAKRAAQELRDVGVKICAVYVGSGVMPAALKEVSDKQFAMRDIQKAVSECRNRLKQDVLLGEHAEARDLDQFKLF